MRCRALPPAKMVATCPVVDGHAECARTDRRDQTTHRGVRACVPCTCICLYKHVLDSRAIDLSLAIMTQASHQDTLCRAADPRIADGAGDVDGSRSRHDAQHRRTCTVLVRIHITHTSANGRSRRSQVAKRTQHKEISGRRSASRQPRRRDVKGLQCPPGAYACVLCNNAGLFSLAHFMSGRRQMHLSTEINTACIPTFTCLRQAGS